MADVFERWVRDKKDAWDNTAGSGDGIGVISFKDQQAVYEAELAKDQTDILDRIDPGTPARQFLGDTLEWAKLIDAFDMTAHLDKGYRQLSTGQSRKLMILSRITAGCTCLALESPYDGLDTAGRRSLDHALGQLHRDGTTLFVCVNNISDIPGWCTHIGVVEMDGPAFSGPRSRVWPKLVTSARENLPDFRATVRDLHRPHSGKKELVMLKNGTAGYAGQVIFKDVTLNVSQGDHTLVTGPNGCGKSTLLQVITGDHHACYTNELRVFGRKRGTGESIWELKKEMGIVSSDLHRNYLVPGTACHCVLSGFFDSIGLYQPFSAQQEKLAMQWLSKIGLADRKDDAFRSLDYPDQRLVLIARALIKSPELLILDEPTQGLDESNRHALLDFLAAIAAEKICTILYVSHREDEFRSFFTQTLDMGEKTMP